MYLSLIFLLTLLIPCISMPKPIKMAIASPYRIVLASIITTCGAAAVIFMVAAMSGESVYSQLYEICKIISKEAASNPMVTESFKMAEVGEDDLYKMFLTVYDRSLKLLPVSIMFMSAIVSYIAYIIQSNILSKKYKVRKMPKLREFSFPHGAAMAVMLMYLVAWIMAESGSSTNEMLYLNMNMLFDTVFSIQGITVVLMFFHMKRLPKAVGIIVLVIMWCTSIGRMFLVLMGMCDLIIGLKVRINGGRARKL